MALKRVITQDQNLQFIQDNVQTALIPLENAPLSGGVYLGPLTLTSGQDNLIAHTLGRVPQKYIAGIPNVDTRIWSPTSSSLSGSNASSTLLNLRCSTSCTVSIWVN